MDGHGDYSPLDRPRLLTSGLEGGASGSGQSSHPGGGSVHLTVTELAARAATPTTLSTLAQYQSRYGLPPTALPGFPRYLMAGGLYPPYPPLFPATDSLSLLGAGVACVSGGAGPSPTHHAVQYQRILEMHKDAYLASMTVAAANHHPALYGLNPGGLNPFLEQNQSSQHSTAPISLVKQEPKELSSPAEKPGKHLERHSSLDLDYSRSGKEGAISHSAHHMKGKMSPSTSSSTLTSTLGSSGKHDKKVTPVTTSASCSNNPQSLKRSSSSTSMNSAPRQPQDHLRTKPSSPASSRASPTVFSGSSKILGSHSSSSSNPNKKNKSSTHTKIWKGSERQQNVPPETQSHLPRVNLPSQGSAHAIPLATVQHDGILLSALASPSSAAASSANSSMLTSIKHTADRSNRLSTSTKEAVESASDAGVSWTPERQLAESVSPGNERTNETCPSNASVEQCEDRLIGPCSSREDSSDIVVDSTEETSRISTKSEHDRAIEETIERVASAADSDVEATADSGPFPCPGRLGSISLLVPPVISIVKSDATGAVSSSVSSGGNRTVCAKTLNIPSITASGSLGSRNISKQANASALPFYHTKGVRRVHATTYVPEIGIFKGPSIKSFTKNSLSLPPSTASTASLEDRCRPDPKYLQVSPLVVGHDRTDSSTPSPASLTPDAISNGMNIGDISSSLDTASVDSQSVRSQSVTSVHSLKEEYDDLSDDEVKGLVIDDDAVDNSDDVVSQVGHKTPDSGPLDGDEQRDKSDDRPIISAQIDNPSILGVSERTSTSPCNKTSVHMIKVGNEAKMNSKVPSEIGEPKLYFNEAIDYSLPKNLLLRRTSSQSSASTAAHHDIGAADLPSSLSTCKNSSSVDKRGHSAHKKTPPPFKPFVSHSASSAALQSCTKLLNTRQAVRVGSSKSSSSSCKISSMACKPEQTALKTSCHGLDKKTPRRHLKTDSSQPVSRCDSAPPIVGSSTVLTSAVSLTKSHVIGDGRCSKLSLDLSDRTESSNDHSLGNTIPVGIAVAQIRPHHVHTSRDYQASESRGHDVRLSSGGGKPQGSQTTTTEPLPPNLVTGHNVNSSSWITQMPFTIHQALNTAGGATFGASHYPVTPPSGFKFTQDSITGQIYLVATGVDTGVWHNNNLTSTTGTGNPHFTANSGLPSVTSPDNKIVITKEEANPVVSGDSVPDQIISTTDKNVVAADAVKHQTLVQQFISVKGVPTPSFTSATAATALVSPVTGHSATTTTTPFVDIKAGPTSVQSRGCSPIQFEDTLSPLAILSTLSAVKRTSLCSIGVQTCDNLVQTDEKNVSSKLSLNDQGVQTLTTDLSALNPLSVQCPDLDSVVDHLTPKANVERTSYNPFTDPQILQAADGLELLSALAEKRPKCSSLDDPKRIFPSPSDSFKSDTASILAIDDTLSPGDTELKSGQCTPRREVRRDLSPKWSLPKKETPSLAFGDFKAPSGKEELCSDSSDVRVKMAEVQRQYKEKQKKLAKLQNKKNEDGLQNKRGPGRPPKKKQGSKKSDDDSSSSSSKTKDHSGHNQHKKKRPAEELVDRVFRKLPPVVKPCKVSRSIHYVKSKTGPFFKRKSASSSVKRNKDLFGFDESNWPSFSERKHQEKVKVSAVQGEKHKHKHKFSSSHSADSKHLVSGNIFESINNEFIERRGRPAKNGSLKETKLSSTSLLMVKTEPSFLQSSQDSGLGLLAKFALTPTTQLTSPTATLSTLTLATTATCSTHVTVMSQLSTTSFSSNSSIYGSMYNNIYHITSSSSTPAITFGSRSSLMSSANSSLMSFSSPGLSAAMKVSASTPISTSQTALAASSVLSQALSGSQGTAAVWTASVSPPCVNHSSSAEESSGTPCGSEASPHKRKHEDDSDTDTSESSPNKKRKPGRPKKINPDLSTGGTETIWAKKSSNLGLLQVSDSNSGVKDIDNKKPLDLNSMKPLFLDEEWTRRRSERIFLSETSPQPSPAISPSPRGEPVWKLSNFMPKSKKILDVNKSVKDGDGKDQSNSSQKQAPTTATVVNVVKTEETPMPTLSAFSWSPVPKLQEATSVKSEKDVPKVEDSNSSQTSSSHKPKKSLERVKDLSKEREKKKAEKTKKVKSKEETQIHDQPPVLVKKEKRAEEHSKIKLQKAKSLHDLTQRVKKKYSKANKKQDEQTQPKKGKKRRNASTDSSDNDNRPLSSYRDEPPTPEPRSCKLQTNDLREGLKVLYLNDGLFYEGIVKAIQPPDVYGVLTAGQRGSRPHILCQEEVLKDAVLDVRPDSIRHLPEGTRVCAFWSQQFSCLYPGTVTKSSPCSSSNSTEAVFVEFDDGDSGKIPIGHIRLLPSDFPIVEYEPDPLANIPKRRRQATSELTENKKSSEASKSVKSDRKQQEKDEDQEEKSDTDESTAPETSTRFWRWLGTSTKRPGLKGKAKKVFYRSITRGKEIITVGDSAVFVSTGRVNCPFIGRIQSLWQGWNGQMMVKVQWYYHPEETQSNKKLSDPKNALFESHHEDENDVQTISHRCQVLRYAQFKKRHTKASKKGRTLGANIFYVAGFYDPSFKELKFYPGVS
ncbi:serine-rich adhesin for platelets-like isoform X2 [Biomphalaria glabrata]|uniref:Serine-rich adhesin for platelets-like isoform X2 n=1 Tax=Biomphalaria glabrata TaxID=6526 RepID=A0A9W2ZMY2_BIOGL|nr:serine-rich adhesin for platelets-like isoform X2 [Biomphalaria glabrata]